MTKEGSMAEELLTPEQAAELFVNRLITRAYKLGIRDMKRVGGRANGSSAVGGVGCIAPMVPTSG